MSAPTDQNQQINVPKPPQHGALPSFLAPSSGQSSMMPSASQSEGNDKMNGTKNPSGGLSQPTAFSGMPMMNGGMMTS